MTDKTHHSAVSTVVRDGERCNNHRCEKTFITKTENVKKR